MEDLVVAQSGRILDGRAVEQLLPGRATCRRRDEQEVHGEAALDTAENTRPELRADVIASARRRIDDELVHRFATQPARPPATR